MAQPRIRKSVRNRLKPLRNPEELAKRMDKMKQNQNVKLFLLLILPLVFLLFGLLMFRPWDRKDQTKVETVVETVGGGGGGVGGGVEGEGGGGGGGGERNARVREKDEEERVREKRKVEVGGDEPDDEVVGTNVKQQIGSKGVPKDDAPLIRNGPGGEEKRPKEGTADPGRPTSEAGRKPASPSKVEQNSRQSPDVGGNHLRGAAQSHRATFQGPPDLGTADLHGRRINGVELTPSKSHNSSVRVYKFDNFLTDRECDGLMQAHRKHVKEFSEVDPIFCCDHISTFEKHLQEAGKKLKISKADFIPGTTCLHANHSAEFSSLLKKSYSTAFYPGESPFSSIFEDRVKQATGLNPSNGGKLQITSYGKGVGYKTHTDCIIGGADRRDRMATILVYLVDVPRGGETSFTELGIEVRPKKGMAIVWNNMNEDGICEPLSLHTAAEVTEGHKYILQRWYYYQSFFSLGKRPPEPPIPERLPKTARVACDEYEHGSCRWYDEWNYDHIPDYIQKMSSLS